MTVYGRKDLKWVKNSLWNKDNYILAIVPDKNAKGMFWIKWPDGTQSKDYYNKTRAKNHAIALTVGELNDMVVEAD